MRITNNTDEPVRFSKISGLAPGLLGLDNTVHSSGWRRLTRRNARPQESDYPVIMSGESYTFFVEVKLFWKNGQLFAEGSDELGHSWTFAEIELDTPYLLWMRHLSLPEVTEQPAEILSPFEPWLNPFNPEQLALVEARVLQDEEFEIITIDRVIGNYINTPPMEIRFVYPES